MYYILTILMLNEKLFIHQPIVSMANRPTFLLFNFINSKTLFKILSQFILCWVAIWSIAVTIMG